MKNNKLRTKFIFLIITLIILPVGIYAYDFGITANINTGLNNANQDETTFNFGLNLWPYYSTLINDNSEFIVSASVSLGYDNSEFFFIPELLRTEFSMRFETSVLRAGRFNYTDPLSFIVSGLFDGVQYFYNTAIGNFNAGLWYTGLLYKKNANITMTNDDMEEFIKPVDSKNISDTYFASRRLFASIGWEHPSVAEMIHLNTAIIFQIDLTDAVNRYNNQYLIVKASIPYSDFLFEFGGSIELSQHTGVEKNIAFAGEAGFYWMIPGEINSRLSFTGIIAGGRIGDLCDAFVPITSKYYGYVLKHKMSGLSIFTAEYIRRFNSSIGAQFTASYFIRNDLGTFTGYPADQSSSGYFLGPEISSSLTWRPASDLFVNFSAGMFIPAIGNTGSQEKTQWRAELSAVMSLY